MKNKSFTIFILLLMLNSCKKNETAESIMLPAQNTAINHIIISNAPGFGPSTRPLTGKPYSFPAGIVMSGSITTSAEPCMNCSYYECETDGTLPFYMTLTNTNTVPTAVIFPAGMVIPSVDTTWQGAVLVQPDTFTIPVGISLSVNLWAMCINDHRSFNENKQVYASPLLSDNTNLSPLIQLLAAKGTVIYDPNEVIQKTVWDIADHDTMSAADITAISALQ